MPDKTARPVAIITGASSGIGAATAQLPLHARGLPQEQPPGYLRHLWPGEF